MWYKANGVYDPFIMSLTEGKSKHLPMEFHKRYSKGGLQWFTGCTSKEQLNLWFSRLDAIELHQAGYKLYEFESNQFVVEENQIIFTREGTIKKKEIPLQTIWDF